MKTITFMKKMLLYCGFWLGYMAPVWAATNGSEDNGNLPVLMFLGYCMVLILTLIYVIRIVPAQHKKDKMEKSFLKWLAH